MCNGPGAKSKVGTPSSGRGRGKEFVQGGHGLMSGTAVACLLCTATAEHSGVGLGHSCPTLMLPSPLDASKMFSCASLQQQSYSPSTVSKAAISTTWPLGAICVTVHEWHGCAQVPLTMHGAWHGPLCKNVQAFLKKGIGGTDCPTSNTCCLPFPMMPKFCAVDTANLFSKNGLNLTLYALKVVLHLGMMAHCDSDQYINKKLV